MEIVTGYKGSAHITSAQDRAGNQGAYGTGSYILNVGSKLAPTIVSANEIRIADGVLSHQGCIGVIESGSYDSLSITSGAQGKYRNDLIVCRYTKNTSTNVENLELVVIQGTAVSSSPSDPAYNTGNIQEGDTPVDFPLFRVVIDGITISSVDQIATSVMTQAESDALIGSSSISDIGNGTVTGILASMNVTTSETLTFNNDTTNYSEPSNWTCYVRKYGNVVQFTYSIVITLKDTGTTAHNITQMPSAYRPSELLILNKEGQGGQKYNIGISTGGYVSLSNLHGSSWAGWMRDTITWIV